MYFIDSMGRNHQCKTEKARWSSEDLETALEAVRNGKSLREESRTSCIPLTTLPDRIKSGNVARLKWELKKKITQLQEKDTAKYCILSNLFYGLIPIEQRQRAFEYAEVNNIRHNFNVSSRLAGKDWLRGFLKRNCKISVRCPQATSFNQVVGFNKFEVTTFFTNLEQEMKKHKFHVNKILNVDESGITNDHKPVS